MNKIRSFADLIAWQESHKLVVFIYKLTDKFPTKEAFALTDQIRRAATSITSNIAEGFSRKTGKEKIQFYYTSLGSLSELQSQLLIARDVGYIKEKIHNDFQDLSTNASKLINGLLKTAKTFGSYT